MSSQSRRYRLAHPAAGDFNPPNVPALGALPFGAQQRAQLSSWLSKGAWPRGHMQMAELEGFLAALISWPVGISPGAWLPPIWGVRGWKIPAVISAGGHYDEFVGLVVGFMQEVDRDLSGDASGFESSVLWSLRGQAQIEGLHQWGRGFMTALAMGAQGLKWRSPTASSAVHIIASHTSSPAAVSAPDPAKVVGAVLALMPLRTSRGPLGPLPAPPARR